jgi:hypothetical protein
LSLKLWIEKGIDNSEVAVEINAENMKLNFSV